MGDSGSHGAGEGVGAARSRYLRFVVSLGLLLSIIGVGLTTVLIPPAAAQAGLEVEAGVAGYAVAGEPIPIRVRVESDRLVNGEVVIRARFSNQDVVVRRTVELAGGAARDLDLVVPSTTWEMPSIRVALESGGKPLIEERVPVTWDTRQQLVGVLPALAAAAGTLPEVIDLSTGWGQARFGELRPTWIDAGSDALAVLDTVVGTEDDLTGLNEEQSASLMHWVASGGSLLVDEPAEPPIAGLPEDWQPGGLGHARAERGVVRLTGGRAADGDWDEILLPTPAVIDWEQTGLWVESTFFDPSVYDVTPIVALDAGFRIPDVTRYLVVIGGYILVVGPLTYLALRRIGRRTAAWLVIPVVAGITTFGIAVLGDDLRSRNANAHATLFEITPEGTRATSHAMVTSRSGGSSIVGAPDDWVGEPGLGFRGGGDAMPSVEVRDTDGGTELDLDLDPGEFQMLRASGPTDITEPMLRVSAVSDDDGQVRGTIENTTDARIQEVGLFIEDRAEHLGDIGPGETVEFDIDEVDQHYDADSDARVWEEFRDPFSMGFDDDVEFDDFGNPIGIEGRFDDTVFNPALWVEAVERDPWNLRRYGEVVVVGWSDELSSPLTQDGNTIENGRSALVARAPIESAARLTDVSAVRTLVGEEHDAAAHAVFRMMLPTAVDGRPVDPDRLVLEVPAAIRDGDLLLGDRWAPLIPGFGRRVVLLSPDAVHGGSVYVRITGASALRRANGHDGEPELVLRELGDDETFEGVDLDRLAELADFLAENEPPPIEEFLATTEEEE